MRLGLPELIVIWSMVAFAGAVVLLPFWFIFRKAGFSGWMSVSQVIPIVNVIALFYLAFAEWPIHRDRQRPA